MKKNTFCYICGWNIDVSRVVAYTVVGGQITIIFDGIDKPLNLSSENNSARSTFEDFKIQVRNFESVLGV